MSSDDTQALRDITYFTRELLSYDSVLPSGLTAMLRDFVSELDDALSSRWMGIGDATEPSLMAGHIGQAIADGKFMEGAALDASSLGRDWYALGETCDTIENALRLLAAKGEIISRCGRYYVRPRDKNF